jgi:hypothetical protein
LSGEDRVLFELGRGMTGAERVAMVARLADEERAAICAGFRAQHPDYSDRQVFLALVRVLHGDELVRRAWPAEPLVES